MTLRAWKINWVSNQNQDKDYSAADLLLLADSAVISGLAVTTWSVAAGRAVIKCVRTSTTPNETIFVHVENTTAVSIDTTGTKKVWIEVQQTSINTAASNTNADGSGIAIINTGASYPAGNYVPLASITAGVITDERQYLKINAFENTGLQKGKKSTDIASATTTDLSTANGNYVHITGTTTITSFGNSTPAGTQMTVVFDWILTLTHNATSLKLPTGANIITQVWDAAIFESEWSGNWKCVSYLRADWQAVGATLPSIPTLQKTFVAWENISAWDSVYTNYYRDSTISQLTWSSFYNWGSHTHWQTINTTGLKILVDVVWYFYWADNSSVYETLQIYDTPGGTLLWSNTIYDWKAKGTSATITFSPNLDISAYSSIYLHFSNNQPYVNNDFNTADVYAWGQRYYDGSPASWDLKFSLTVLADWVGKVYKTDASNRFRKNFIGFAAETITAGNNIRINTDGVSNNLSSLVSWSTYYTSATPWAITLTPAWTYAVAVGKATSATEISIDFEETTLKVSDSELARSSTEVGTYSTSYVKLKEIKVMKSGVYRTSFGLRTSSWWNRVYWRIYVNDVAVWTEQSTTSTWEAVCTEDITVNGWDLVQVYARSWWSQTAYVANFVLKASIFSTSFAPIVNI